MTTLAPGFAAAFPPVAAQTQVGTDPRPRNPIEVVKDTHAPVLGLYGGADARIPHDSAPHASFADHRPSCRQGPGQDGWKRALARFRAHGVA